MSTATASRATKNRVVVSTREFAAAFAQASAFCPSKTPKAILQSILLKADPEGDTELIATDLEIGIRRRVIGVQVSEPVSMLLPVAKVAAILKTTEDEMIRLEVVDERLKITGARNRFELAVEDPALFPEPPGFDATDYHVVAAADIARAIRRTVFCTDPGSTKYALGGCLFEFSNTAIVIVATDGRKLARQEITAEKEGDGVKVKPVMPPKGLKYLSSIDPEDPPVHIAADGNRAIIRTNDAVIYTRLVEGRFPDYRQIIDVKHNARAEVKASDFIRALSQAAITTSDESRGVDFLFSSEVLRMQARAADVGESEIELPIAYQGTGIEICFDPRYIADALRTLDPESTVHFELMDSKNAGILRTEDNYLYLAMPLTREK